MVERSKCMNVPELRFKGFKQEWDFCSVGDFYYFKNGLNKGSPQSDAPPSASSRTE